MQIRTDEQTGMDSQSRDAQRQALPNEQQVVRRRSTCHGFSSSCVVATQARMRAKERNRKVVSRQLARTEPYLIFFKKNMLKSIKLKRCSGTIL